MEQCWTGIFILPSSVYNQIPEKAKAYIEKAGFDIISELKPDKNQCDDVSDFIKDKTFFDSCDTFVFLIVTDLSPWRGEKWQIPAEIKDGHNNFRLIKRAPLIEEKILHELQSYHSIKAANIITWTEHSSQALKILELLDSELLKAVVDEISNRSEKMKIPSHFQLEHRFEGFNTNGEVCKISYKGEYAILRIFRPGRETFLQNEKRVLELSSKIEGLPKLLQADSNWVLTTCFENAVSISDKKDKYGYLPLEPTRKAFKICKEIFDEGIALLDFIPANVLINSKNEVHLIDFEWIGEVDKSESFESGPVIMGYKHRIDFKSPNGPPKSFTADWKRLTGVSYHDLMNKPIRYLETRNKLKHLIKSFRNRVGRILKKVKP